MQKMFVLGQGGFATSASLKLAVGRGPATALRSATATTAGRANSVTNVSHFQSNHGDKFQRDSYSLKWELMDSYGAARVTLAVKFGFNNSFCVTLKSVWWAQIVLPLLLFIEDICASCSRNVIFEWDIKSILRWMWPKEKNRFGSRTTFQSPKLFKRSWRLATGITVQYGL